MNIDQSLNIVVCGDIMLGGNSADPFKQIKEYLDNSDIAIANLEAPLSNRGNPAENKIFYDLQKFR